MPIEIYLNVAASGLLTGLVYGLMALGLSVIFGVVRVVNFAHGEMMTIGMYIAVIAFSTLGLDPLVMTVPIAAVLFVFGYLLQKSLINPFINRPDIETIGAGGYLALAAAAGVDVSVVTCTRGERGEVIPPELAELESKVLGAQERVWRWSDGMMFTQALRAEPLGQSRAGDNR